MGCVNRSCFIILLFCCSSVLGVVVKTKYGSVEGQSHSLHNGKEINSFLGIPFAKPPTGELRWKAPEEPEPWTETFKANKVRSACLHYNTALVGLTHRNWTDYNEDCLFINIYTPKNLGKGPYPVLVFIHGGGYTVGANFQYPGYMLASYDVVVVAPNYRLNAMGFASTRDSGNYGLLDQQLALKFVRDNIKAFGGDPNKVTISGQSAGASSVGLHAVAPSSQGLFHQVIHQSGTDMAYWALQDAAQKPWTYTEQLAKAMSCPTGDNEKMFACLRKLPGNTVNNFTPSCTKGYPCLGFGPVVDGSFLPDDPFILRNSTNFKRVPTLAGLMKKDAGVLLSFAYPNDDLCKGITYKQFETGLREDISTFLAGEEHLIEDMYQAARLVYSPWGQRSNMQANRDALIHAATDLSYGFPNNLVLRDAIDNSAPAFSYIMTYFSKGTGYEKWIGATHIYDMPYNFGYNYFKRNPSVWKESRFTHDLIDYNEEDDKMADYMMTMWTNFVKHGHPTPEPVMTPSGESILWRPYTKDTRESLMIDLQSHHEMRYRQQAYALFTEYIPYIYLKRKAIVTTKYGDIQGQSHTLHNGKEISSFIGVPFAKPPTGELRWKAPQDPEPWTETLKANKVRSACLQFSRTIIGMTHENWTDFSEDCLFMNIYTPKDLSKGPYPVMVFIHGGSFTMGANFQFPGYMLASYDVVVVVPNYRLHAMGFASTGDSVSPGNYGFLDQQQALKFVRDNIKAFGGDPNKVTIAGQSAGGASVGMHTIAPSSQGLFHQAIYQSGSDVANWAVQDAIQKPWTYTQQLAEAMNCTTSNNQLMIDCLRRLPGEMVNNFFPICTDGHFCMGFGPVVDGSFLPDDPFILRNSSSYIRVPTMSGIMEKDGSFVIAVAYSDKNMCKGLTYKEFEQALHEDISYLLKGEENKIDSVYEAFKFFYTKWGQEGNMQLNRDQLVHASTDLGYGFPGDLVLRDANDNSAPAFSYVMSYFSNGTGLDKWIGATHIYDIPYVFGQSLLKRNPSVWKESAFTHDLIDYNADDDKMADYVMTLWSNFVKHGHPTPTPVTTPMGESMSWKPYNKDTRETFFIDKKPYHQMRYRQQAYALFTEYIPYLYSKNKSTVN